MTRGETAQQFDRSDLSSGVISYKHVGEIGNQIVVDQFDIIAHKIVQRDLVMILGNIYSEI